MFPTSPTLTEWRLLAAAKLAAQGKPLPPGYDGTDAATSRLFQAADGEGARLQYAMQLVILSRPADFTPVQLETARRIVGTASNADTYGAAAAKQDYSALSMAADFAGEMGKNAVALATHPVDYVKKNFTTGPAAAKADPKGFATVALAGIALGVGAWYFFGRKGAA